MTAKIGLCGDIMSHIGLIIQEQEGCDFRDHFSPGLTRLCQDHDELWGNLEGPLTENTDGLAVHSAMEAIKTNWPKLFFLERNLPVLHDLKFRMLGVANNHSFDFDTPDDTRRTTEILTRNGFDAAGRDFEPVIRNVNGLSFAIFAVTCFVNPPLKHAGVALLDDDTLPDFLEIVRRHSRDVDYTVVQIHWGWDYVAEPTPAVRSMARRLLEAGVNIVYGNHPHILWPIEQPSPRQLVCYSLGNFSQVFGSGSINQQYSIFRKAAHSGLLTLEIDREEIRPTFQPLQLRHNYDEWLKELGTTMSYWHWSPEQFLAWKSSIPFRQNKLFSQVCLDGENLGVPLRMDHISARYTWLRSGLQENAVYNINEL